MYMCIKNELESALMYYVNLLFVIVSSFCNKENSPCLLNVLCVKYIFA